MQKILVGLLMGGAFPAFGQVLFTPASISSVGTSSAQAVIGPAPNEPLRVTIMGKYVPDFRSAPVSSGPVSATAPEFESGWVGRPTADSVRVRAWLDSLQTSDDQLDALSDARLMTLTDQLATLYRDTPAILPIKIGNLAKYRVSSRFGMRWHPITDKLHNYAGIDLPQPALTPVYATADGYVDRVIWQPEGLGLAVLLVHASGYQTVYGHLADHCVLLGQPVRRGERIGRVGETGLATGPHLHYSVLDRGRAVDPARFCFLLMRTVKTAPDEKMRPTTPIRPKRSSNGALGVHPLGIRPVVLPPVTWALPQRVWTPPETCSVRMRRRLLNRR